MKFIKNILNKLHLFSFVRHNSEKDRRITEKKIERKQSEFLDRQYKKITKRLLSLNDV